MFKLKYVIEHHPEVEEEYESYKQVVDRIIDLKEDFTSCSVFQVLVYDADNNLIQGADKL